MPVTLETLTILSHETMGRDARLLRLKRPSWSWQAGELVGILGATPNEQRDYTICSGEKDETLDVLYRLIPHGTLTPFLFKKTVGDSVQVQGPYGRFVLRDKTRPILFCATGTGIAPCRAFLHSNPGLNLTLLHGVRYPEDLYFQEEFTDISYHSFCSRSALTGMTGRLTEVLHTLPLEPNTHVYLCGANEMIYEAEEILAARGLDFNSVFHEPYYYRAYD